MSIPSNKAEWVCTATQQNVRLCLLSSGQTNAEARPSRVLLPRRHHHALASCCCFLPVAIDQWSGQWFGGPWIDVAMLYANQRTARHVVGVSIILPSFASFFPALKAPTAAQPHFCALVQMSNCCVRQQLAPLTTRLWVVPRATQLGGPSMQPSFVTVVHPLSQPLLFISHPFSASIG